MAVQQSIARWTKPELAILRRLKTPGDIQRFLDDIPYSVDHFYRSPRSVLRDRVAHCFDGALFAASALRRLGHRPRLIDLVAVRDDDHLIAVFQTRGCYGAVAKSNFATLRFREPVYRTLRELVMSYFEGFFNVDGEKTLRTYSAPFDLSRFDRLNWETDDAAAERIVDGLNAARHFPVASRQAIAKLEKVDQRSYDAGMLGSRAAGLYVPEGSGWKPDQ